MTAIESRAVSGNPYLRGALAPVQAEVTAFDLSVTGRIPEHLDGRYLRNGANPAAGVDPDRHHWFAGDAMVHGLALRDGKACWYRNRWIRTPAVCQTLGERQPDRDLRAGIVNVGPNTNVMGHAGRTLAIVEAGVANYELTEELATVGTWTADETLFGGYTAHPLIDPITGDLHAVSYSAARGRAVQYSVIGTDGRLRRTVDIEVAGAPMMHAFSLTDRYVVIYDLPVTWDPAALAALTVPPALRLPVHLALRTQLGKFRMPGPLEVQMNRFTKRFDTLPFSWNENYPSRIGVMPRDGHGADVRWFDIEPCYVFHPLNAYSEVHDGVEKLTLDVIRNDRMFDRERRGPADGRPTLDRWTVNLATGEVRTESRDDRTQEFPRINESLTGTRHRYGYTVGVEGGQVWDQRPDELRTVLYKHDFVTGSATTAPLDSELVVGELVFVPNPDATDEDDGVLMGYGYHRASDEGQLLILDAQTLEVVATVHLPQRVPMGFHGNWLPA